LERLELEWVVVARLLLERLVVERILVERLVLERIVVERILVEWLELEWLVVARFLLERFLLERIVVERFLLERFLLEWLVMEWLVVARLVLAITPIARRAFVGHNEVTHVGAHKRTSWLSSALRPEVARNVAGPIGVCRRPKPFCRSDLSFARTVRRVFRRRGSTDRWPGR
jgi:hypothetical protein